MTTTERRKVPAAPARGRSKKPAAVSPNVLTPDPTTDVTLSSEALSIRQRNAARLLAIGYTQQQAAEAVGVDKRTITRWCDEEAFHATVEQLHLTAWERIQPGVYSTLEMAIEVVQQMLRGELKADDKRYLAAERLIDRLLSRLFAVGAAPAANDPAADGSVHPVAALPSGPVRSV